MSFSTARNSRNLSDARSGGFTSRRMKKLSERFQAIGTSQGSPAPLSVRRLIEIYVREKTPTKGLSTQVHDRAAARLWIAFFDAQPEQARGSQRHPSGLDKMDWDRFMEARRRGLIPGWERTVRNRAVAYDLKFLISVLRWATGLEPSEEAFLDSNPWNFDRRATRGMVLPRERKKSRPGMPSEIRELLLKHSPNWQFAAALELERETRRRNNAIRQLLWSDIDMKRREIAWRPEIEKTGWGNVTPLTDRAFEVLRNLPSRGVGEVPVFPSGTDPMKPTSRHTFQTWLRRAKRRLLKGLPEGQWPDVARRLRRVGFHSEKRSGVRDVWFRNLPAKIQEEMAGTRWTTLRDVYDDVSASDIREAWKGLATGSDAN